jgi:hypothetical protein
MKHNVANIQTRHYPTMRVSAHLTLMRQSLYANIYSSLTLPHLELLVLSRPPFACFLFSFNISFLAFLFFAFSSTFKQCHFLPCHFFPHRIEAAGKVRLDDLTQLVNGEYNKRKYE